MYITYEAIYFVLNSYGNKLHRPFGREMKQRIDHRRWTEIQAIAKQKPEKTLYKQFQLTWEYGKSVLGFIFRLRGADE